MSIKIAPSVDCANYINLENDINKVDRGGADLLHIDIMDGHFVPNLTAGPKLVTAIKNITDISLDVHLAVDNPELFIPIFSQAGADILTIHVEVCDRLYQVIKQIKSKNIKVGIAINPITPIDSIKNILSRIDMILVMCVDPGFAGQKFIKDVIPKINKLNNIIREKNLDVDIQVDGNINRKTIKLTKQAGANVFVLGTSSIFKNNKDLEEQTMLYKKYCRTC